jgi:methionyl aminopeptidase
MKQQANGFLYDSNICILHGDEWLVKQRVAGKVAAGALSLLEQEVKSGTTKSLLELDKLAETYIRDNGCIPTFLGYKGFPNSVCISVGQQLVHGICTDYHLQDGDKVSVDLGCTFGGGAIADSALTVIYGNPSSQQIKLLDACEEALFRGLSAIAVGKRLGCIGHTISRCAKGYGYGNIVQYGGHGLDWNVPHAIPFVSNKAELNEGIRIQYGLTLALEPMLTSGSVETWMDKDGWTIWCKADLVSHYEHTVFVHKNHIEILSYRGNENYLKSDKIYFGV